jgi:hypothetical protein
VVTRLYESEAKVVEEVMTTNISENLLKDFPEIDFTKTAIDFSNVLSGGPGKDGIPAISNPKFEAVSKSTISDRTRGILLEIDGESRFYPYNILVWHEIVNDSIGNNYFAVTFCPLCGSAIVFNRIIDGDIVEFGVSGYLYESNMIMYDRRNPGSLWSQSLGSGIAGVNSGKKLEILKFQLLELGEVKKSNPTAIVMTTDTGYNRDYTLYPYGSYDFEEQLLFPTSVDDMRYSAKEIFYIVPVKDKSVALRIGELENGVTTTGPEGLNALKNSSGEISITDNNGQDLPGYYEMWFSWAIHHQDDGTVWDSSK